MLPVTPTVSPAALQADSPAASNPPGDLTRSPGSGPRPGMLPPVQCSLPYTRDAYEKLPHSAQTPEMDFFIL